MVGRRLGQWFGQNTGHGNLKMVSHVDEGIS